VGGELGIGAVQLRVIQVRPVHPGLEVVRDQSSRDPAEERERLGMRPCPGLLIHPHHGADEQVPGAGQHHHERPHRHRLPADRVAPAAQAPVVDLRLAARLGRWAQHLHLLALAAAGLLRQLGGHQRRREATDESKPRSVTSR
jgi:hypothetical protein